MNINVEIENEETDAAAEILKENIKFFVKTPRGSLPQMRGYGFDYDVIDESFYTLRMKATVDIVSGIRKYYGITISSIDITENEDGEAIIKIKI